MGDKAEWLDKVAANVGSVDYKFVIDMPDGSQRKVKSATAVIYFRSVVHGKYMDILPAGNQGDSSTTYYCDLYNFGSSVGRAAYRSSSYAYASGGVSCTGANSDSLYTSVNIGSRLAFRGTLVRAASVEAYKALSEVS